MGSRNVLVAIDSNIISFTSTNRDDRLTNRECLSCKRPAQEPDRYQTWCISVMHMLSPRLKFERYKPTTCQYKTEQYNQVKVDFACASRLFRPEEEQH